jgi:N utilization substance protein A
MSSSSTGSSSRSGSSASDIDMPEALQALAAERGITLDTLLSALADALESAYKRLPGAHEYAWVTIDPDSFEFRVFAMALDDEGDPVGDEMDVTPNDFGRIAAQTAKQVMSQRLREIDREQKYEEYAGREGDIVTGIIQQNDSRYTLLDLGRVEALLPQAEQVPYERPEPGARVKAYIVEVRKTSKGPQIVVSRTHPGLIRRLFELEVPEIADGVVELKACAREPGHRTKIAVWSNDNNVDPVGACVGARGARVRMVVNELRGEKIDIVPFSEDPPDFVAKALSPARVKEVRIDEETGTATVIVPDFQLSLAIGKEGQNARLAARLTGWRVDIKSETQIAEEEAGIGQYAEADDAEDYAEGEWKENADTGDLEWHPADGGPALTAEQWDAAVGADVAPVDDAAPPTADDTAAAPDGGDPVEPMGDTAAATDEAAPDPVAPLHDVLADPPTDDVPLDEALAAALEVEVVPVVEIPTLADMVEAETPVADADSPDAPDPADSPDDDSRGTEPVRPDEATP